MTAYTDEQIAAAAHAATMALQALDNDESPAPPWMCEDRAIKALTIAGVRLARVRLPQNNGDVEKTADQLHQAWCDGKRDQGWVYGPVKDRERKTHPCLRPRRELPEHQQVKDRLLVAITAELSASAPPGQASSRCTHWSDPSDDFYGMCVKEAWHDREGDPDHENEHGIRWTD